METEREGRDEGGRRTRLARNLGRSAVTIVGIAAILGTMALSGCRSSLELNRGAIEISVRSGPNWDHRHPLFLGLAMYTQPQIAIWAEDANGTYLGTLFVTKKSATQGWLPSVGENVQAGDIRRPEALPAWSHRRGVVYSDGLFMPTSARPVVDAVTAATPKGDFSLAIEPAGESGTIRLFAEFNQSLDFNDAYPEGAKRGEAGYSGGKFGSGQPSLVYEADLDSGTDGVDFVLVGHGSADGSDGTIDPDLSGITGAKRIVDRVTARVVR
jgi:hypothetical protein